ncbi:MAG: UbiD family decarboxylase, partial [Thermodesulfobacteriota bacterium]|nr:UbiD family decarboxylase [Thermodesulfobacteriota bacterium]
ASPREPRPVFHITAVTYRNDPILTMSCMGVPVDDCQLQMAVTLTAVMWDELVEQKQFPITDIRVVAECCVFLTIISTKTPYTSIAHHIATAFWGTKYGAHCPYLIVVNDDIDVMDMDQVMHAVTTKCHPVRGLQVMDNTPGQALFPFLSLEERLHGKGKHVLFDCTWPLDWDPAIAVPPRASFDAIYPKDLREKVLNNWSNYGY